MGILKCYNLEIWWVKYLRMEGNEFNIKKLVSILGLDLDMVMGRLLVCIL